MNLYKSINVVLFFILCGITSVAGADVVIYTEGSQHKLYLSGGTTLTVRFSNGLPAHIASDGWDANANADGNQVVVVNKLATYWVKPAYGSGRIRVTVPIQFYLTSWDVKALEKELERLGVKVKPKPLSKPGPKPGPVISG